MWMMKDSPAAIITNASLVFWDGLAVAAGSACFSASTNACLELPVHHLVHTRLKGCDCSVHDCRKRWRV